jgi:acyl-CoA thioester hydrolase
MSDHTLFPVKLSLRIDWSELDVFHHVNNVAILKYVQAARVNYWEVIGLIDMYNATQVGPMLASTSCQFRKPLFYPGGITTETGVESIGNSSFVLVHRIINEKSEVVAEAKDVVVIYDFSKNEKAAFPAELRSKIQMLEKRMH